MRGTEAVPWGSESWETLGGGSRSFLGVVMSKQSLEGLASAEKSPDRSACSGQGLPKE